MVVEEERRRQLIGGSISELLEMEKVFSILLSLSEYIYYGESKILLLILKK